MQLLPALAVSPYTIQPLLMSNDLRSLPAEAKAILQNKLAKLVTPAGFTGVGDM